MTRKARPPKETKVDYDGTILSGPKKGQKIKSKKLLKLFKHLEKNPEA